MTFFSRIYTKTSLLIGILIVVYLLPIWLFDYFPTQDGVSHVYNSQIITEYGNQTYQFRDYYDINWFPFPNWLSHISLTLLMFIFPPLTAEKVFLSLYVILFPLAIRYFLNAVQSGRDSLVILSFTFIYNYLLLMGFYNFAVSVPLFFLALGFWWKHKDALGKTRIVEKSCIRSHSCILKSNWISTKRAIAVPFFFAGIYLLFFNVSTAASSRP